MKIAIHHNPNSFSDKWEEYCALNNVEYKIVNCYSNSIIEDIRDCDVLMWHWYHYKSEDPLFAKQLLYSVELMGKKVFPNMKTVWHFDDKVGQKYLLEAIRAPFVNTYVFYDRLEAENWVKTNSFPKVFKLRGGAGSENVRRIDSKSEAIRLVNQAFKRGFSGADRFYSLKEKLCRFRRDQTASSLIEICKGIARAIIPHKDKSHPAREKGYIYFQDFIPNNDCDIRIIVIGNRAFGIKRMVRVGDFRASGSGDIVYDEKCIPLECVSIAFDLSKKLGVQCLAYDFVFLNNEAKIVEISYGFNQNVYLDCRGYWNERLEFIEGKFFPEYFMIEDIIGK